MGLVGILLGLGLLIALAFRGWSVLLLAPVAALIAAAFAGEPLLAHWTQTFMGSAARFVGQFFPLFLLGALWLDPFPTFLGVRRSVCFAQPRPFDAAGSTFACVPAPLRRSR